MRKSNGRRRRQVVEVLREVVRAQAERGCGHGNAPVRPNNNAETEQGSLLRPTQTANFVNERLENPPSYSAVDWESRGAGEDLYKMEERSATVQNITHCFTHCCSTPHRPPHPQSSCSSHEPSRTSSSHLPALRVEVQDIGVVGKEYVRRSRGSHARTTEDSDQMV